MPNQLKLYVDFYPGGTLDSLLMEKRGFDHPTIAPYMLRPMTGGSSRNALLLRVLRVVNQSSGHQVTALFVPTYRSDDWFRQPNCRWKRTAPRVSFILDMKPASIWRYAVFCPTRSPILAKINRANVFHL